MARPSNYTVHVPNEVRDLLETAPSDQAVEQGLFRIHRTHRVPLGLLRTHALHQACARDDARLVERLLSNVHEHARTTLVNSPLGSHSYTPLCRAAYAGSIHMTKLLVAASASVGFRNCHGENVLSCISNGFEGLAEKMPENIIFLRERFDECARFIEACQLWEERQRERASAINVRANAYVPRRVRLERACAVIAPWWRSVRAKRRRADEDCALAQGDAPAAPAPSLPSGGLPDPAPRLKCDGEGGQQGAAPPSDAQAPRARGARRRGRRRNKTRESETAKE